MMGERKTLGSPLITRIKRLWKRSVFPRVVILVLVIVVLYKAWERQVGNVYQNYCAQPINEIVINTTDDGTCHIPKLDPFHPDAMAHIRNLDQPLRCKVKKRATLRSGVLSITGSDVLSASYRWISRPDGDDFSYSLSDPITVRNFNAFPVKEEFIVLTLNISTGESLKEYLMQAVRRPELVARTKVNTKLQLSFTIIAIDSISNAHAQRKLPKSFKYIKDVLGGYVFMGHSVVGDGTTEQVAAFMTGKGEQEYHESRRGEPGAKTVDEWNWMFKKAKEHGYVTSYSEDSTRLGTFQFRLLGFKDPPTDYYERPFFMAAEEDFVRSNPSCIGAEKIYEYHLDLAREIYEQYPEKQKFLFHFAGEISHGSFDTVQLMDEGLLQFMTDYKDKGYLEDTVLIVLGDHGWRAGAFRETMQGKLEERLPLFTMTFPKSFKERYPHLAENLATNTQRLTSWFDVYATFNHLFDYPNKPQHVTHGKSLLEEMPADRTCLDAGIPEHWCPCTQWSAVDTEHKHAKAAALEAVKHINGLNSREVLAARHCKLLQLDMLNQAMVETPTTKVSKFKRTADRDGRVPEYLQSDTRWKDSCRYQVTFVTLPNKGVFEASVHFLNGMFEVKGSVSRLNRYGDQPKCIEHILPHLRKYCVCKEY